MFQLPAWLVNLVPGTLPDAGTWVLYAILVSAAYTFFTALQAAQRHPRLLKSARLGAYATCTLVALGVLLLSYAFLTHDYRIQYVARYSERAMPWYYQLTALWGGQDGSLLWWLFLLSLYVSACIRWMHGRYRELQPFVIATLMVIIGFFAVLMIYSANPFQASLAGARPDGEGLNPLLRNYWMIIHPPALYIGFVGCAVPFAFAMAALLTGRLDTEWLSAVRKWMIFAWLFLTIGNTLGMVWAYEELGWGGYWGWDPVENAACLPWFTASAFLHSAMVQERRDMLKVWNIALIVLTFFLTIFGTFLTRSGLISSVHSFAKSDIGIYFVYFMGLIVASSVSLVVYRYPQLKARASIESNLSREAMFLWNNWLLLGIMTFIATATTWPLIAEWLLQRKSTVGAPFYNTWVTAPGLAVYALMGLATVLGWRKTSQKALREGMYYPVLAAFLMLAAHAAFGSILGFPPVAVWEPVGIGNPTFDSLQKTVFSYFPLVASCLTAFNVAVIVQEFARGIGARQSASEKRGDGEGLVSALLTLIVKNQRRYGGYLVHAGLVLMMVGFTGNVWQINREVSMLPGETVNVGGYDFLYKGPRMEVDPEKRMVFADLEVRNGGAVRGEMSPAKFIYTGGQGMATTEIGLLRGFRDDLHVALGSADPKSKRATLHLRVNALVSYIWLGLMVIIFGATVALWPQVSLGQSRVWAYSRSAAGVASTAAFCVYFAMAPSLSWNVRRSSQAIEKSAAGVDHGPATTRHEAWERASTRDRTPLRD